jgi:hypothetical protein
MAMKKLGLLIGLFIIFGGMQAVAGGKTTCYVKSNDKVYFGQDVHIGIWNTTIESEDGTLLRFPNRKVEAYMHDDQLFEKLPVTVAKSGVPELHMMEFIESRSGFKLYRCPNPVNSDQAYSYYVFLNGKFHLNVTERNAPSVMPFFGLTAE